MNKRTLFIVSACAFFVLAGCKHKINQQVVESYADGLPKVTEEVVISNEGDTVMTRETYFFPGEKKYMEKQFNSKGQPDGVWVSWYENGNKNSQGTYVNGKWHGVYRVWYPNGNLRYTGEYDNGVRVGVWKFYDSTGTLVNKEDLNLNINR